MGLQIALSLFVNLCISFLSVSQEIATPFLQTPTRDPQAVQVLQNTIAALGGQSAIALIRNSVATGNVVPATGSSASAGTFKWEYDLSGASYEFRSEVTTAGTTQTLVSGHGSPAFNNGTKTQSLSPFMVPSSPPFHLPGVVLLRELNDATYSVSFIENTSISGRPAIHIKTMVTTDSTLSLVSPQDWFIDAVTWLPLRVQYRIPNTRDPYSYQTGSSDFSNYQQQLGLQIPFTTVSSEGDSPSCTISISSVSFNVEVSPSDFTLTASGAN